MIVAILPARAGSKRIPDKNVKAFRGRPMIAWPLAAARASGVFDRVLVSTDSEAIAAVARAEGAEAPFLRPAELSDDHTPTAPVMKHALEWLSAQGVETTAFCCIYPATPLLDAKWLRAGLELLRARRAAAVVPILRYAHPIQRAFRLDGDQLVRLHPEHEMTRTNDLPATFHDAGQFYWCDTATFLAEPRMIPPGACGLELPHDRVVDIDRPDDWAHAEALHAALGAS